MHRKGVISTLNREERGSQSREEKSIQISPKKKKGGGQISDCNTSEGQKSPENEVKDKKGDGNCLERKKKRKSPQGWKKGLLAPARYQSGQLIKRPVSRPKGMRA